jgi:hypothetical protein
MIGTSSFYVPQVNQSGSMATFVIPASIPISAIGRNGGRTTALGALRVVRRGLGQDASIDFGTPPDIMATTSTDTLPTWITTPSGGPVNPGADVAEGGGYIPPSPTQTYHVPGTTGGPTNFFDQIASSWLKGAWSTPGMPAQGPLSLQAQNPLASLTSSSMLPILLVAGVLVVALVAKKK